jgi:hypothetical protein
MEKDTMIELTELNHILYSSKTHSKDNLIEVSINLCLRILYIHKNKK